MKDILTHPGDNQPPLVESGNSDSDESGPTSEDTLAVSGPRFACIPEDLLYDSTLSDGAIRVYGVLIRHGDCPTNCFPGYERIARLVGKSPRSIPRIMGELEKAKWITRLQRKGTNGQYRSCAYTVHTVRVQRASERDGCVAVETCRSEIERDADSQVRASASQNATATARESAHNESNSERKQLSRGQPEVLSFPSNVVGDPKGSRSRRSTPFPEGKFLITAEMRAWAADNGFDYLDLRAETAHFKDHALAKGLTYRDWTAAWHNWIRKAAEFHPRGRSEVPIEAWR